MKLNAWRVKFSGQPLLVAEQSLVEYLPAAQLHPVPGADKGWSAVVEYNRQWLPVLCWPSNRPGEITPVLILQLENQSQIAVCMKEPPNRCLLSDDQFMANPGKLPELWLDLIVSCVELNREILPIISPDRLLKFNVLPLFSQTAA